jgi:hypothetical protein
LLYPAIALAGGLLAAIGIRDADAWTYLLSLGWYAVAYGALYRRPWWRVLAWIAVLWAALLVPLVVVVMAIAIVLVATGVKRPGT